MMKAAFTFVFAMVLPVVGEVTITGFHDGQLTVSNAAPSGSRVFYAVEWRSSLNPSTPWTGDWAGLSDFRSTNAVSTMAVPMFFRVNSFADNPTTDPGDHWLMYSNAVVDASNAVPAKVSRNLTPVVLSNTNLSWRTDSDGVIQVKLCCCMSAAAAARFYPIGKHLVNHGDLWVTVYPELKEFCQSFYGPDQALRVKQLLGASPSSANDTIVEFWVTPDVLFRPTPDPDIASVSAGVLSSSAAPLLTTNCRVNPNWAEWYNDTYASRDYGMVKGVYSAGTWTRLGYTYDWASTRPNHEGLSEYVIPATTLWDRQNIPVNLEVVGQFPAATYGTASP